MKKALLFIAIIALLVSCAKTTTPEAPFVQSKLEVTSGNLWHADIFSPELNETIKIGKFQIQIIKKHSTKIELVKLKVINK